MGGVKHLLVGGFFDLSEHAEVSDDREGEHLHTEVAGHDGFGHGGHAHGVGAEDVEGVVFGGGFVARTGNADIDAVLQFDIVLFGHLLCQFHHAVRVGLAHVGEAGTELVVVGTKQGVVGHEVDMVGDDHDVGDVEGGVEAAGGVGEDEFFDAELAEHLDGEGEGLHRVALVVVEAAAHNEDGGAVEGAEDEGAAVALYGGDGEVGNIFVVDFLFILDFLHEAAEAGAEHDGDFGAGGDVLLDEQGAFFNFFDV